MHARPRLVASANSARDAAPALNAEANHRIANNLATVAAFLRLQANEAGARSEPIAPAAVRDMLREAAVRIEGVGRLHRHLANGPSDPMVDLSRYLEDLCADMAESTGYAGDLSFVRKGGSSCSVGRDKAAPLALAVVEAIKYAHPAGPPGRIAVSCRAAGAGPLVVEVEDDGIGLPEGFDVERGGGLGLRVLRSLVAQLNGKLELESGPLGLTVRIFAGAVEPPPVC